MEPKKDIEKLLFNFKIAYIYSFIAGILVAVSINLFTSVLLMELSSFRVKLMWLALFILISSFTAFSISIILEFARNEWQSAGSPNDEIVIREDFIEKGKRKKFLWICLVLTFLIPSSYLIIIF